MRAVMMPYQDRAAEMADPPPGIPVGAFGIPGGPVPFLAPRAHRSQKVSPVHRVV